MRMHIGLSLTIGALIFPAFACGRGANVSSGSDQSSPSATIAQLRDPLAGDWVGRNVTVEGFYYGETIPMIVDDIKRVYVDTPMPPDAYLPIVGPIPSGLKTGDRVAVTGLVSRPEPGDPPQVAQEKTIIRISEPGQVRLLEGKKGG